MKYRLLSVTLLSLVFVFALLAVEGAQQAAAAARAGSPGKASFTGQVHSPAVCSSAVVVTSTLDSGAGTLRQAIADACAGGLITFGGNYTITLASTLTIGKNLTIDGTGRAVGVSGDGSTRVFTVTAGVSATLQYLTVADGLPTGHGGGIFNSGALTVIHGTFTNNQVASWGAANLGGGIYNQGTLTVIDSTFTGNLAGGTAVSAAIANGPGGTATITRSSFNSNEGDGGAGAIGNFGNAMTVDNCSFTGNIAPAGYSGGGAIWNASENLTVTNSIFYSNTAGTDTGGYSSNGGAILNYGTMTVTGSTFDSNSAWGVGGAIAGESSGSFTHLTHATNNTFRGNSAKTWKTVPGKGGAIYASANSAVITLTLANNTFAQNDAPRGSNLYYEQVNTGGSMTANLYNNILLKGTSDGNCYILNDPSYGTPTTNVSGSLADDLTCGTEMATSSSIALGMFGNYGGSTQTFPLLATSVAIDAGDSARCPSADQRGKPRDDLQCDVGAYELKYADSPAVIRPVSSAITTTFGSALIGIQRNASQTAPGVITVTKSLTWKTKPNNAIDAYWYITPTVVATDFNLTLTLCYTPTESHSLALGALRFWRFSAGAWNSVSGAPVTSTIGLNSCATITGVNELSVWTLGGSTQPNAVTMQAFSVRSDVLPVAGLPLLALIAAGALVIMRGRRVHFHAV